MLTFPGHPVGIATRAQGGGEPAWLSAAIGRMATAPTSVDRARLRRLAAAVPVGKLDTFYRMNAETEQASTRNLVADAYNLSKVDAPVFSAGRGWTGDASNDALATGFTPSTASGKHSLDNATFGAMIYGPVSASGAKVDMGAQGGTGASYWGVNGSAALLVRINSGSEVAIAGVANPRGVGLWTLVRRNATDVDVYCGKNKIGAYTNSSVALPTGQFRLLASSAGSYSDRSVTHAFIGAALSDAEVALLADAVHADARSTGAYAERAAIICDGNSLTTGFNAQTPYTTTLQSAYDTQGLAVEVINRGVAGQTTVDMITRQGGVAVRSAMQYPADRRIVVAWELRNYLATAVGTPQQAIDSLASYCATARALGADKIIVCNAIADGSGDADFSPSIQAEVNSLLAAQYSGFADYLVDLAADARFQNPNDTTYYAADKLHLISAGYAVVSELVKPVVDQALASLGIV